MASLLDLLKPNGTRGGLLGDLQHPREDSADDSAGGIGTFTSNNPLTLMALGAGIAQGGIGRGLQLAVPALNLERQEFRRGAMQAATYKALRAAGVPHGQALTGALHPEVLKAIARSGFGTMAAGAPQEPNSVPIDRSVDKTDTQNSADPNALGKNVTAVNSAIGQLGKLMKAHVELGTSVNAGADSDSEQKISPLDSELVSFKEAGPQRQAALDDIERLFRASGIDNAQIREWKDDIAKANSPAELKAGVGRALELLNSRLEKLQLAYERATGRSAPELLYPNSTRALRNMRSLVQGQETGEQSR
jgi:hypothetical protein